MKACFELDAKELEDKFENITKKNVMTLTPCYTDNFRRVNPDVLRDQLIILKDRSDELHNLAMEYHLGCGKEFESPFYKAAVVTGDLALRKLVEIFGGLEEQNGNWN
ncbi:MAG: hypothetical protein PHH54_06190 [Candidatus Nanoarchaeia archaeon]|nr:hypothetical protein [Candidatus Nanoarchaeia archaeon]MDD5741544.1 hypothetical protein [Candidatus Nanoarchaeia archaeon]